MNFNIDIVRIRYGPVHVYIHTYITDIFPSSVHWEGLEVMTCRSNGHVYHGDFDFKNHFPLKGITAV